MGIKELYIQKAELTQRIKKIENILCANPCMNILKLKIGIILILEEMESGLNTKEKIKASKKLDKEIKKQQNIFEYLKKNSTKLADELRDEKERLRKCEREISILKDWFKGDEDDED